MRKFLAEIALFTTALSYVNAIAAEKSGGDLSSLPPLAELVPKAGSVESANSGRHDSAFENWQVKNLKDPDSAKWKRYRDAHQADVTLKRGLLGKKSWSGTIACYTLNAKNSYGGYTGYTEFAVMIANDGSVLVWEGMPTSEKGLYRSYGQQIIDNYC